MAFWWDMLCIRNNEQWTFVPTNNSEKYFKNSHSNDDVRCDSCVLRLQQLAAIFLVGSGKLVGFIYIENIVNIVMSSNDFDDARFLWHFLGRRVYFSALYFNETQINTWKSTCSTACELTGCCAYGNIFFCALSTIHHLSAVTLMRFKFNQPTFNGRFLIR